MYFLTHKQSSAREKGNRRVWGNFVEFGTKTMKSKWKHQEENEEYLFLEELYLRVEHAFSGRIIRNFLEWEMRAAEQRGKTEKKQVLYWSLGHLGCKSQLRPESSRTLVFLRNDVEKENYNTILEGRRTFRARTNSGNGEFLLCFSCKSCDNDYLSCPFTLFHLAPCGAQLS